MLDLDHYVSLKTILDSDNLADKFDDDDLGIIASEVIQGYAADKSSRQEWEQRTAEANDLALQVMQHKSFPWDGASNVKFPLLTMAAMQYHARAYPALIPDVNVVGCQVIGDDPDGQKAARAARISGHMSYQLMEEDTGWEDGMDTCLLVHSILGTGFKKTYYDAVAEIKRSEFVLPKDLVVDYYTKTLDRAARITHVIELSANEVKERENQGIYREVDTTRQVPLVTDPISAAADNRQGVQANTERDAPAVFLEQHCWMDLDDDGYKEPYIVTVEEGTQQVRRIVARFGQQNIKYDKDKKLVAISAENYFTKYPFIPSPDGGFYDLGFGALLGGVNHAVDTLINQLIDAGTLKNGGGGFIARGIKQRGGNLSFSPGEWKRTDSTGEDLQKGIFPLPAAEPSTTLYQLLGLLIDVGQKIGMATDPQVGENPGQNTPAETSRNTIQQGRMVFNAIYKRAYRAMKEEFKKLYRLNYLYPPENGKYDYASGGVGGTALATDYSPNAKGVIPTADPYITSNEEAQQQVNDLLAIAGTPLGAKLDSDAILARFMKSRRITNPQELISKQPPPPPPVPYQVQVAQLQAQTAQAQLQLKAVEMQQKAQQAQADIIEEQRVNDAKIAQLQAQAALFVSQAQGEADGKQIALIDAQIAIAKRDDDRYNAQLQEVQHQRDTALGLLEHVRNVKKDQADANKPA